MPQSVAFWSALCIGILAFENIDSSEGINCRDDVGACQDIVDTGTTPRSFVLGQECIVPTIPNSRLFYKSNGVLDSVRGGTVPHLSLINYRCQFDYELVGPLHNFCNRGSWRIKTHPTCGKYCPSLNKHKRSYSFKSNCEWNGFPILCDDPIKPGTVARISCRKHYKKRNLENPDTLVCQEDGKWDNEIFHCEQVCGDLVTRSTPFIANDEFINITFVPWHVAIYKKQSTKYHYHCGGTILNADHIFSATRCFLDVSGKLLEYSLFSVGAGKHLGDYNANDPAAQLRNIKLIARLHLNDNIILIVLMEPLYFTPLIGPACFFDDFPSATQSTITEGSIANYGREDEDKMFTRDIRIVKMMKSTECPSIRCGKTDTTICVTYPCVKNSCRGFIGSGFTVEKLVNGSIKHYFWGVASDCFSPSGNFFRTRRFAVFGFEDNIYQQFPDLL